MSHVVPTWVMLLRHDSCRSWRLSCETHVYETSILYTYKYLELQKKIQKHDKSYAHASHDVCYAWKSRHDSCFAGMTHIHLTWLVMFMTRVVRDACVGDMTHVTCYAWRHGACSSDRTHVFHDACYAWKTRHDARLKNIGHAVFFKSHVWKTWDMTRQDSSFRTWLMHVFQTWRTSEKYESCHVLYESSLKSMSHDATWLMFLRHDSCTSCRHESLPDISDMRHDACLSSMTYVVETCLMLCMKNAMCCSDVTHVHQSWFIIWNAKWLVSFRHETCFSKTTCVFHHVACTQKERRTSKTQKESRYVTSFVHGFQETRLEQCLFVFLFIRVPRFCCGYCAISHGSLDWFEVDPSARPASSFRAIC